MLPAHIILVTLTSLIVMAVGEPPPRPDDPGRLFKEAGVTGTFLLYNMQTGQTEGYSPERWDSAYIPASTFKIFNALVALETSVVPDETTTVAWDGVQRTRPEWNRDQNLASAFRTSAVWFFQRLARLIGPERMQAYLDSVGYGNRIMGGPIDMFWLSGGLRISMARGGLEINFQLFNSGDLPLDILSVYVDDSLESNHLRVYLDGVYLQGAKVRFPLHLENGEFLTLQSRHKISLGMGSTDALFAADMRSLPKSILYDVCEYIERIWKKTILCR